MRARWDTTCPPCAAVGQGGTDSLTLAARGLRRDAGRHTCGATHTPCRLPNARLFPGLPGATSAGPACRARISMPTSLSPQEVHPTVPPAHAACNVMLPGRPPATPIVAVRAMAEPFLPQAAPAPAAPSRAEVAPTALACKNPSLTILIRDFEMQMLGAMRTPQLPGDWQSDLGCLAQCGRHITEVLSELAQQKRILVPLPGGASVPVSLLGREGPPVQAWYQVYAGHQELLAEALQMREDVVRSFFRQSSCASNQLTWRLGEVQGFLRLCFTSVGLPAPSCHPAVWYQLIREIHDAPEAVLNEEQGVELIGHGLPYRSRVRPGVVHLGGVLVKQVACGEHHSLVLTAHGEVYSFGCNLHGALGSGRCGSQEQAERVLGNHLRSMPVRGIAAGPQSSMALSIGGRSEPTVLAPVSVPTLPGVARAIAAGGQHSAVILRRGRLFLAGDNRSGQLGQSRKDVEPWPLTEVFM
eukprot:g10125.t1